MEQLDLMFQFIERYMDVNETERNIVLSSNRVQTFKKNEIIKSSCAAPDDAYFVLSGCVASFYAARDEQVVGEFFFPGDPVLIPMSSKPSESAYELRAIEPTTLAVSNAAEGERLVRLMPRFERICRIFAEEKLAQTTRFHDQLRRLTPLEQYRFVFKERRILVDRVPQHLLANYLGMAPETLSRVRRQIQRGDLDLNQ